MSERITGEIDAILNKRSPSDEQQVPPWNLPPPGTIRFVDVQMYDIPAENLPANLFSAESALEPEDDDIPEPLVQDGRHWKPPQESLETASQAPSTRRCLRPLPLTLIVLCVLFAGAVSMASMLPLLAPSATITIIPDSRQITTTTIVSVVMGIAHLAQYQLEGRVLATVSMSQAQTVPTTGIGRQDARAAHGLITFYNAAPSAQTVAAGMMLTGADGVEVVTDQNAVIPAVVYPTLGQATVSAHAVTTGPEGNIRAGDIYGLCCRLNVSAVNSAFSGSQNARSFDMVTPQDIEGIATSLTTSLKQSVRAALQTQVHDDETLIMPLPCKQKVTADHAAGDEAAQVLVTVDESCSGEVYYTQVYQSLIAQILTQEANKQLGESYTLSSHIKATINRVTIKEHGMVDLEVLGTGTWEYQFSQEQLQRLKTMIAGKNEAQAKAIVLHIPGIHAISITFKNGTTIPTNLEHIHLIFLELIS